MSFLKISRYHNFFKSLISIIYINFLIKTDSKKVIFFYFSRKDLTLKDIDFISDLFKELKKEYLVFYGHKLNSINKERFFFITEGMIKFVNNVDLFVSNYICDVFPKNAKKIYIHHSLYDTPLTGKKKELETINRIKKYNYIFLSSKSLAESFSKLFFKNKEKQDLIIKSTGYPRFDYFNKIKNKNKDSIIIAPANFLAYPQHSIIDFIDKIIQTIKKDFKFKIIVRPHPANKKKFSLSQDKNSSVYKLINKYKNDKKVLFDFSDDYSNTYGRSCLMISDLSGTSFTYSFLTKRPVIFLSLRERLFKKQYKNLNYYKDRKKIGLVISDVKKMSPSIKTILNSNKKYEKSISILKNKIDYLGKSKIKTVEEIKNILSS